VQKNMPLMQKNMPLMQKYLLHQHLPQVTNWAEILAVIFIWRCCSPNVILENFYPHVPLLELPTTIFIPPSPSAFKHCNRLKISPFKALSISNRMLKGIYVILSAFYCFIGDADFLSLDEYLHLSVLLSTWSDWTYLICMHFW
jgi:hypothetical protein